MQIRPVTKMLVQSARALFLCLLGSRTLRRGALALAAAVFGQILFAQGMESVVGTPAAAELPDAPTPTASVMDAAASTSTVAPAAVSDRTTPVDCSLDMTRAKRCHVHWGQLIISTTLFNAFEDAGNLYTGYYYRTETTQGDWFDRWINSAAGWRWNVWNDANPVIDDYVGHPFMGAIT